MGKRKGKKAPQGPPEEPTAEAKAMRELFYRPKEEATVEVNHEEDTPVEESKVSPEKGANKKKRKRNKKKKVQQEEAKAEPNEVALDSTPLKYKLGESL